LAGRDISILDPDKATLDFKDFLEDLAQRTLAEEDVADRNVDQQLLVSNILTLPMCKLLDLKADFQVSDLYDSLLEAWIKPLSYTVPSRTRVTTERLLRNIAGQLCLTSYVARQDLAGHGGYTVPDKASATGGQFILPVRGRASAASVSKGKQPAARSQSPGASSQLSDDVGFLSSSPLRALPTPEPTPSLRSQSSISSLAGDSASQRLQGYASLAPQPALPIKLLNSILGHWQVGTDPEGYDWEAAEQAFASEDEEEMEARAEERKRAAKHLKRQRDPTVGPSSQPKPKRLGGSQPQQGQEDTQGSSQATESMAVASQVEPGRFGGRPHKKKKKKASGLRPAGFK